MKYDQLDKRIARHLAGLRAPIRRQPEPEPPIASRPIPSRKQAYRTPQSGQSHWHNGAETKHTRRPSIHASRQSTRTFAVLNRNPNADAPLNTQISVRRPGNPKASFRNYK